MGRGDGQARRRPGRAFTLIELLIVVAIIAILAAIAVPNFLDAQVRAKVSRTMADLRTGGIAIEAYRVDWNEYPGTFEIARQVTTPVAYMSDSKLKDPFGTLKPVSSFIDEIYGYANFEEPFVQQAIIEPSLPDPADQDEIIRQRWLIMGRGPDQRFTQEDPSAGYQITVPGLGLLLEQMLDGTAHYDPTNGTVSGGDIIILQRGFDKSALRPR